MSHIAASNLTLVFDNTSVMQRNATQPHVAGDRTCLYGGLDEGGCWSGSPVTFWPIDRGPSALRISKLRGVHLAIVVENQDGDGNPGYRVRVKYPWLSEQDKSYWARIVVPMAGPDRGTYFLPEPDDQVLVVFEHGDINRPLVIGALWSKKQEPVEVNDSGKNNTKLIKSRAGHRIIFDDREGAEKITIVDRTKKNKIVLDSVNKIVRIESDGDIVIKSAANVVFHGNALKVGTSGKLIGKGQQVLCHASSTFGLKAKGSVVIDGSSVTINVSNSPAARVSGSGAGFLGGVGQEQAKEQVPEQQYGGGGDGAAAGGQETTTGDAADDAADDTEQSSPVTEPTSFIELVLLDQEGQPVGFQRYRVEASDGTVREGLLDGDGKARIDGIVPGTCQVSFPGFHPDDWGPE